MKKTILKKMGTFVLTGVLMVGSLAGCSSKSSGNRLETIEKNGKLQVIVDPTFLPYEFIDNTKEGQEQYQGADMQLARYIAKQLDVELEIIPLEWSAVLAGMAEGKYDMAISGLAYTEERAEAMALSKPYMTDESNKHGLLVRQEDVDLYTAMDDFKGKTIGVQSGTLQENYVKSQMNDVTIKTFDSNQNAVLALQSGKVDAVALNYANAELFMEANEGLAMAAPEFDSSQEGVVVAVPLGEGELLDKVNEIIDDVVAQGIYNEWFAEAKEQAAALGLE